MGRKQLHAYKKKVNLEVLPYVNTTETKTALKGMTRYKQDKR